MRFSYTVNNQVLLKNISLSFTAGKVSLITGVENINLGILAGIIARLIPTPATSAISQITALLENYVGELTIHEGELPVNVAYVGVDPDRYFLFATVAEEIQAQLGIINCLPYLAQVGLPADFASRHIATLSGGEKMRLALALAFAHEAQTYILHGCIPWLDKKGREMLIQMVLAKKNQAQIIIIEQETQVISHLVDEVLLFDGTTLHPVTRQQFFTKTLAATKQLELNRTSSTTPLLEFKNICFGYQRPLLTNVSFSLKTKQNYLLLGENGAGKSTIAQMIFRVFKPQSGTIILKEKIINHYPRSTLNQIISYVGQFPLQQITLSTIGDYQQAISHPLLLKLLIKYLNLADNFPIALLSFLQLKLLNLISSLSLTTELIILDEPTWGIDDAGKKILWQLLEELAEFLNFTLLIITHDEQLQLAFPAHILRLQNKEILNAEF